MTVTPVQFQPVFSEVAEVCGVPAAVALYANGTDGPRPAVLDQWPDAAQLLTDAMPDVQSAWHISGSASNAYAWVMADSPRVVMVVSTGYVPCEPEALIQQVHPGSGW